MTRWVLAEAAADDLERLLGFLVDRFPEDAVQTVDHITDALNILQQHPCIDRPREPALHELVISRGRTGHLAMDEYDEAA